MIESNTCQCGEIETAMHYLLYCPLFKEEREVLRKRLFDIYVEFYSPRLEYVTGCEES